MNRWWTRAAAGQILTFLIIASLSSKDFFFYKSGTFLLFFVTGKTCTAEEPKEVLLSDFYVSSSLTICQDKYCKHDRFVQIKTGTRVKGAQREKEINTRGKIVS